MAGVNADRDDRPKATGRPGHVAEAVEDGGEIDRDKVVCRDPATGREIPRRPSYASPRLRDA